MSTRKILTPQAMLEGRQQAISDERDRKLAEARERRAQSRAAARQKAAADSAQPSTASYTNSDAAEDRALLGSNSSAAPLPLTNISSALSEISSSSAKSVQKNRISENRFGYAARLEAS